LPPKDVWLTVMQAVLPALVWGNGPEKQANADDAPAPVSSAPSELVAMRRRKRRRSVRGTPGIPFPDARAIRASDHKSESLNPPPRDIRSGTLAPEQSQEWITSGFDGAVAEAQHWRSARRAQINWPERAAMHNPSAGQKRVKMRSGSVLKLLNKSSADGAASMSQ
jgi:hypothetical protein